MSHTQKTAAHTTGHGTRLKQGFANPFLGKSRKDFPGKSESHNGKYQILHQIIQWDYAWSEKKVELWQRWRKFWENPAITKDLICRNACKKNFPCKYTKAPNISNYHQTTFGRYVCHKSYLRYKPDQARSFASTQQTPKWPKRSKKGSLSRHDLPHIWLN